MRDWREFSLIRVFHCFFFIIIFSSPFTGFSQDGTLDVSFGLAGKISITGGNLGENGAAIVLQPDGKCVILDLSPSSVPTTPYSFYSNYYLYRFNTNGTIDNNFGKSGHATIPVGNTEVYMTGKALAMTNNGKFVIAASDHTVSIAKQLMVLQYNADGTPDNSFGNNSKVLIDLGYKYQHGNCVAVQNDGKILVGGILESGNGYGPSAVCRLNADGTPDNSFGTSGKVFLNKGLFFMDIINVIRIQSDQKILVGGRCWINNVSRVAVARLNADGTFDATFNGNGTCSILMGAISNYANDIDIQNDCKIVVAGGSQDKTTDMMMCVARLNSDGSLDNSFNGNGFKLIGEGTSSSISSSVKVLNDDKIILAGSNNFVRNRYYNYAVIKLNSDGSFDNSFANNGKYYYDWSSGTEKNVQCIYDMAVQKDGNIIVTGAVSQPYAAGILRIKNTIAPPQAGNTTSPFVQITASTQKACENLPVTFTANAVNSSSSSYQWKKNNLPIGTDDIHFTGSLVAGDTIACELTSTTCKGPVVIKSNSIVMQASADTVPVVSVSSSASEICKGSSVDFFAKNESGNKRAQYQWIVNGVKTGDNTDILKNSFTSDASVQCIMTVPLCSNVQASATSEAIMIKVLEPLMPSISISASADSVCNDMPFSFTARAIQGGVHPTYQWKINGMPVAANDSTWIATSLSDGDIVTCELTVDKAAICFSNTSALSNQVKIRKFIPPIPSVSIQASSEKMCGTKPVQFTSHLVNGNNNANYHWYVNGNLIGGNSSLLTIISPRDGDRLTCQVSVPVAGCNAPLDATSNSIVLSVKPVPTINIEPLDTTIFSGSSIVLHTNVSPGNVNFTWSPKSSLTDAQKLSPLTVALQKNTIFHLEVVSADGCAASSDAIVKVINLLMIPNSFTPNGDGRNDVFRIPQNSLLQLNYFSVYDRWGGRIFHTTDISKGWDGRYNGIMLDPGVFVYFIRGNYLGKEIQLKGTVTLIR